MFEPSLHVCHDSFMSVTSFHECTDESRSSISHEYSAAQKRRVRLAWRFAGVMQCGAVWCGVVQCVTACCGMLQRVAVQCHVVPCGAVWCSVV